VTRREADTLQRIDAALDAARRDPRPFAPLAPYADDAHTTVETIRKHRPGAVRMGPSGRLIANPTDRGKRIRPLAVEGDVGFVIVRGSEVAKRANSVWKIQYAFAQQPTPENERALTKLAGTRLGGHTVETNPDTILTLADAGAFGELDMAEAYRELFG
jgi:hypothetical protein